MSFNLYNRCFELSFLYTVALLSLYITKRDATIPMTYSRAFDDWGGVRSLFSDETSPVTWPHLDSIIWCPRGAKSSPQCGCIINYYNQTYWPDITENSLARPNLSAADLAVLTSLGQKHSSGIIDACLRSRPSWRKDSCGDFCRVHLATPILLSCVYMCVIFSSITWYHNRWMLLVRCHAPWILSLAVIVCQLAFDATGGIISTLSVLSVMLECYYLGPWPPWRSQVFYSYHRFFVAALGVWAAVTHQARDIYLVASYSIIAFFAGFLSYAVFLIKHRPPTRHSGAVCLHLFFGVGAVISSFFLLIPQHWYYGSPLWSSTVSPVVFIFALLQCITQTPLTAVPVGWNVFFSILLLTVCFVTVSVDLSNT